MAHESKNSAQKANGKLDKEDSPSTSSETDTTDQEDRGKEFLKAYFSSDTDNPALTASLLAQVSADDPSVAASLGLLYDYYVQESAQSPTSPTAERYRYLSAHLRIQVTGSQVRQIYVSDQSLALGTCSLTFAANLRHSVCDTNKIKKRHIEKTKNAERRYIL